MVLRLFCVSGLAFAVQGLGLGFGVEGLGFKVWNGGFRLGLYDAYNYIYARMHTYHV